MKKVHIIGQISSIVYNLLAYSGYAYIKHYLFPVFSLITWWRWCGGGIFHGSFVFCMDYTFGVVESQTNKWGMRTIFHFQCNIWAISEWLWLIKQFGIWNTLLLYYDYYSFLPLPTFPFLYLVLYNLFLLLFFDFLILPLLLFCVPLYPCIHVICMIFSHSLHHKLFLYFLVFLLL